MAKNDGGSAFPVPCGTAASSQEHYRFYNEAEFGMTLRDWFAGMAMNGLLTGPGLTNLTYSELARISYSRADAMLAEREKEDDND